MTSLDERTAELRALAAGWGERAPITADQLERLAKNIEEGGPVWQLIRDHPSRREPLFGTRALAAMRWLILNGLAPELSDHLRNMTAGMGDHGYEERLWQLSVRALQDHPGHLRAALTRPVQQHHPGRASHLLSALTMLGAPKVRLLEIGACAGLNLLVDRYHWFGPGWQWGDTGSPVRLMAYGRRPGPLTIVERAGCDLDPRDPADPADVLTLHSYLPPERDVERMELDDAVALAAHSGIRVDKGDAVEWLAAELARPVSEGVHTVVWHSLVWGFLTAAQQTAIEATLVSAARRTPLTRAAFEPHNWTTASRLQLTVYS